MVGLNGPATRVWGIQPAAAALFGVPAGALVLALVSLLTAAPGPRERGVSDLLRTPPGP